VSTKCSHKRCLSILVVIQRFCMEYLHMSLPTHISNVDNIRTMLLSQFFIVKRAFSDDQLCMTVEVLCSNIKGTRNIFTPTALKDFSKGIVPYSIHFMISGRSKSPKLASIEQGRYTVCTQTWTLSVLNWRRPSVELS